jgi:isoquinoline 1-oxidoreductase alpha subunit
MPSIKLIINGEATVFDVDADMPLLWVLRDYAGLTGTKFSCGIGQCGACTVHLNGRPVRSCMIPVSAVEGEEIVTIEGLSENNDHPVQKAWIAEQVPQCGYCQTGQIMNAVALLERFPNPTDEQIESYMLGALCRCGTYPRVLKAIKSVSKT